MAFLTPDVTDERDALATFSAQQLRQLATPLAGLSREQLAAAPSASAMSLGALARHAVFVAERIIGSIEQAPACFAGADRTPDQAAAEGVIAPEALREDDDASVLIAELESLADRADRSIREADMEANVPIPESPWFASAEHWNVRWSALHLIEEMARHAGHADIIRESIDGATAYELLDRADRPEQTGRAR